MNNHQKKMQSEWASNTEKYDHPIGMTGRSPDEILFSETVTDVLNKLELDNDRLTSLLDVGCNNGYLVQCLNPDLDMLIGVDFCLEPLVQGNQINPKMKFAQSEICRLPFAGNSFDRVLCFSLFHYLPSLDVVFSAASELLRVVKPGGRVVIGDLLSAEHKELIPESDRIRWNSKERTFMHRLENWTFVPLEQLSNHLLLDSAENVEFGAQIRQETISTYRYDMVIDK